MTRCAICGREGNWKHGVYCKRCLDRELENFTEEDLRSDVAILENILRRELAAKLPKHREN